MAATLDSTRQTASIYAIFWISAILVAGLISSQIFLQVLDYCQFKSQLAIFECQNSNKSIRNVSVTTYPALHTAEAWASYNEPAKSPEELLRGASTSSYAQMKSRIRESSFNSLDVNSTVYASSNGFLEGAYRAYKQHHHLVIRPEDVWFSILTQLNFYINAHSEELRSMFVDHRDKQDLTIVDNGKLYETADFGRLTQQMSDLLAEKITDPSIKAWVVPSFSTTTNEDRIVSSVIFMSSMQAYFNYIFMIGCGLPSVTLLGTRADWEEILNRLERLPLFGEEASEWFTLLRPVAKRFLKTFDAPEAEDTKDFWQRIAHHEGGGSSPSYVSGWITAFAFWDKHGDMLRNEYNTVVNERHGPQNLLKLDDVTFHHVSDLTVGYVSVPVTIEDLSSGNTVPAMMVAGSVGMELRSSSKSSNSSVINEKMSSQKAPVLDTIQPVSGWFLFEKKEIGNDLEIDAEYIIT